MNTLLHQVGLIARRSLVRTARRPGTWIPPLTFPLMLMAVRTEGRLSVTWTATSDVAVLAPFSTVIEYVPFCPRAKAPE